VIWSEEDGEFVGLCAEFSSLSHLDETQGAALEGITNLVSDIVADMQAAGESPPVPITDRGYSGRLQVRITPELHRLLLSLSRRITLAFPAFPTRNQTTFGDAPRTRLSS
jgi:predicted HicB family RNase H-like nuclease